MNIEFTVTMTTNERERHKKTALEIKEILAALANDIEDPKKRSEMWDKIRKYNAIMEIFTT